MSIEVKNNYFCAACRLSNHKGLFVCSKCSTGFCSDDCMESQYHKTICEHKKTPKIVAIERGRSDEVPKESELNVNIPLWMQVAIVNICSIRPCFFYIADVVVLKLELRLGGRYSVSFNDNEPYILDVKDYGHEHSVLLQSIHDKAIEYASSK